MSRSHRLRLDAELVRRGLSTSRRQAQDAIDAGRVTVSGAPADRSSRLVARSEPIRVLGPDPRYVSRGGDKLTPALEHFGVAVGGARALDAGASTGGFTDCLLQRGAAQVIAVDVGQGQLDARLRADQRVVVLERTNIRDVTSTTLATAMAAAGQQRRTRAGAATGANLEILGGSAPWKPVDVVTADLSFISLTKVIPTLMGTVLREGGDAVLLVKPQFEAGRAEVARGRGVVRDPSTWLATLSAVACALVGARAAMMGAMASPLTGPSGNREFFLHARAGAEAGSVDDVDTMLLEAVRSVAGTFDGTTGAPPGGLSRGG
ncbi:MAG: TlyA family RNA methyltransferase [Acidimicrobiales bacterium]